MTSRPVWLDMAHPKLGIFSTPLFLRRIEQYRHGVFTSDRIVQMYLNTFDPDTVSETVRLLPGEIRDIIHTLVERSPASEQDWAEIASEQRQRAAAMRKEVGSRMPNHGESWAMYDRDGRWQVPALDVSLERAAVYALREAFHFPCHEEPWADWRARHDAELRGCAFHPWQLENRCHWYYFLGGGHFSCSIHGDNQFASNPGRLGRDLSLKLYEQFYWGRTTPRQIQNRLDFVSREYPLYFFNIRSRLRMIRNARRFALSQVDRLRSFVAQNPQWYSQLVIRESTSSQASVFGQVASTEALNELRHFVEAEFTPGMWARFGDAAPGRLLTMLESVTIEEQNRP